MSKPPLTMSGRHDATRTMNRAAQLSTGPRGDGAQAFFDQPPSRLDRIELGRIRREQAQGGAASFDRLPDGGGAMDRQAIHQDHVAATQVRRQLTFHHRTNFSRVVPCQWVPSVIHRCRRMAPIIVRFAPQSIARGSTYSSPRRIHTCERLIVRCAPASSTQTKQSASSARGYVPNWPTWT